MLKEDLNHSLQLAGDELRHVRLKKQAFHMQSTQNSWEEEVAAKK